MPGYVYKGTDYDVKPARQRPRTMTGQFDPSACGTYRGREQHNYYGTPPCDPCKAAAAEYARQWRAKQKANT